MGISPGEKVSMIKKYLPYIGRYRWYAIASPIMMILEVATDIITPMLMAQIVNVGITNGDTAYVTRYALMMIAIAVFGGVMGTWSSHLAATAGYGAAAELRKAAYRSIQDYSFNNIDTMSVPSLITRLTTDTEMIGGVTMMSLRLAFRAPFLLIFAVIFAVRIDAELSLIFLFVIPVLALALSFVFKRAVPQFERMRVKIDALNSVVREQLTGIRVIKSFNREALAKTHFTERNADLKLTTMSALRIILGLFPVMMLMVYGTMIAVLWFGGQRIYIGTMQAGTIIAFLSYVVQIMMSIMLLSMFSINLTNGLAALRRVLEVVDTTSEIRDPEHPVRAISDGSVEFEHVCFKYPGYRDNILNDVSFRIESGMNVGIIGATGSSKSTLVAMIPRLYDAAEGTVRVGGRDVRDYELRALRESIGVVLQKNVLVSGTVRSNMLWGNPQATDEQIIDALKRAQAWDFIADSDDPLSRPVDQGGSNFSGGQKQRLTIARALLTEPKILILDDSTSAVDTDTDARIRRMLAETEPGLTIINIAQRVDSIRHADLIIVLDQGAVAASGTHAHLMAASDIYRDIYQSQQRGISE